MNFDVPRDLLDYLGKLDAFIESEIKPLEQADDNKRFFDHRREWARMGAHQLRRGRTASQGLGGAP